MQSGRINSHSSIDLGSSIARAVLKHLPCIIKPLAAPTEIDVNAILARVTRYLESLRFPVLLIVTAIVFMVNVMVPDALPFIDELLLALVVALLARLKRKKPETSTEKQE